MTKILALTALTAAVQLSACANQALVADPKVKITVEDVLTGIRCEFVDYVGSQKARFASEKPWVIQGKLIVSAETGTSAGASAKLTPFTGATTGFFGIAGSVASKSTSTSTIDFDLDPSTKVVGECQRPEPGFGLAPWLQAVEKAKASSAGLKIKDKSYVFGLTFAVTSSVSGTAGFGIQPLGLNADAARKRDDVQTLTIAIKPRAEREILYIQTVQAPKAAQGAKKLEGPSLWSETPATAPSPTLRRRYIYKPIDLSPELERKQRELLGSP